MLLSAQMTWTMVLAKRGKYNRRSYSTAFKRRVVAETMEPGTSVSVVARRHDLNANRVYSWRSDPRFGPGREVAAFLPVEIEPDRLPPTQEPPDLSGGGQVEIALASGHRLRVSGLFDIDAVLHLAKGLASS
jgi:transposase